MSPRKFADNGTSVDEIHRLIDAMRQADTRWDDRKNLKASYDPGKEVTDLAWYAYTQFRGDNLLYGKLLYPSLIEMAADVVGMALDLLGGGPTSTGTITSGGTESIVLAVKSARDWARSTRGQTGQLEIILPFTGHAAFTKAAELMDIRVVRAELDKGVTSSAEALAELVTENTFMIVGSAPAFPMGCTDDITGFAQIARKNNLWMHVDACVGGFFLPFAAGLGEQITPFDFGIPEVRSMSADLHKYGYTSRGASLILLREQEDIAFQEFSFDQWPTGKFVTATIAGSRPGGAIASAWTVMNYLGRSGYEQRVAKIIAARKKVQSAIDQMEDLMTLGKPEAGIIGIAARAGLDMSKVSQSIMSKGWKFSPLYEPPGLNVLLNQYHLETIDEFIEDLADAADEVRSGTFSESKIELGYGG